MEEKEIIPYNTPEDGVAPTITTMYARLGTNNLTPGEYGGAMGIMEISKDKMEERNIKGVSVHPLSHKLEFDGNVNEEVSPCLRATDYKAPHCVWEEDRRFKDKRLQALVESGKIDPDKVQYLDTFNQSAHEDVAGCIKARIDQNNAYFVTEPKSCASRKRGDEHKIETRNDELANCVTSIDTDSMVQEPLKIPQATKQGYIECPVGGVFDASYPNSELRRGRVQENGEVSLALTTNSEGAILRYEGVEPNPLLRKGAVIANTQLNCYRGTIDEPAPTVCAAAGMGGGHVAMVVEGVEPQVLTPLRTEEGRQLRKQGIEKFSNRALYPREDGVSNCVTSVTKDNLLQEPKKYIDNPLLHPSNEVSTYPVDMASVEDGIQYKGKWMMEGDAVDTSRSETFGTHVMDGVSPALRSERPDANATCIKEGARYRIRKLTEREVFRLQDVDDEDITKIQQAGISKTAQYKLAGNSIVVSCLYHIFRKCFIELDCEEQQLSLF